MENSLVSVTRQSGFWPLSTTSFVMGNKRVQSKVENTNKYASKYFTLIPIFFLYTYSFKATNTSPQGTTTHNNPPHITNNQFHHYHSITHHGLYIPPTSDHMTCIHTKLCKKENHHWYGTAMSDFYVSQLL